jgi:3-hydroxybutyrate dehydrogenase
LSAHTPKTKPKPKQTKKHDQKKPNKQHKVTMHGIGDPDKIEASRSLLAQDTGATVHLSRADLCRPQEIRAMVSDAAAKMGGRVDVLVNNAGIQHVAPVQDFPEDKWDAILAVILSSTFHATKAALPGMIERGWGRVVNTGSMHATVASPYKSAYNAAKHGELLFVVFGWLVWFGLVF